MRTVFKRRNATPGTSDRLKLWAEATRLRSWHRYAMQVLHFRKALVLTLCLALGAGVHAFSIPAASGPAVGLPGMKKDYAITYWWGPPPAFTTEERYKEVAGLGFNIANMSAPDKPMDYYPLPEKPFNLKVLGLCQKAGLKHIVNDKRMFQAFHAKEGWEALVDGVVQDYKNHPALFGYYIWDEPNTEFFPKLGQMVAWLKARDPVHPAFINLFPGAYAPAAEVLKAKDYRDYVDRYIREVKPTFVSYDHYHFLTSDPAPKPVNFANERDRQAWEVAYSNRSNNVDRVGFFNDLEVVRDVSQQHNLPFMVIVLLVTHGPYRDLSEGELRWEAFQTLAYGSSALCWFGYWPPPDDQTYHWRHGVMNADGARTDHYEYLKRINPEVQTVGRKLLGHVSVAVFHAGEEKENVKPFAGYGLVKAATGGRFTLGCFDGGYLMLANKDYAHPTEVTLTLKPGCKVYLADKAKRGNEKRLKVEEGKVSLHLAAGDGELIRFK